MVAQPTKTELPGRTTSIRFARLAVGGHGAKTLAAAEAHGKREDASSLRRQVCQVDPLVYGGLDLEKLYARHTAGCRMDKRMKAPVMHAIIQWPKDLAINEKNERAMLDHAKKFLDDLLGGEAVFAARLDRDEKGKHVVDVFCSPVVTKKDGTRWVQTSTHLKALCERHRAEIERRHPKIKDITGKRQQGIAIQSEWRNYVEARGIKLAPKREKQYGSSDWLTPEQYALDAQRRALVEEQAEIERQKADLEAGRYELEAARKRVNRLEMRAAELVKLRGGDPYPEATAAAKRLLQKPSDALTHSPKPVEPDAPRLTDTDYEA
jgi:hypothetical protein